MRDIYRLASACQVLLALAGFEGESIWTDHGPSKRASWVKGYIRRQPEQPRGDRTRGPGRAASGPGTALSYRERTMLLVAFDLWNGSGDVLFADVLNMTPRLVTAIAGFMEARCTESPEALDAWMARWSTTRSGHE